MLKDKLQYITDQIKQSSRIVISTHKYPDGDGLGSELALYHALKKINKDVRILNLDKTPSRYTFLQTDKYIQSYLLNHEPLQKSDLALILDTNDSRFLGALFTKIESFCRCILFIDHHQPLKHGPKPTPGSYIDVTASSTGELVYHLIKHLGIPLDKDIARAIYTSIIFDTQCFHKISNSGDLHRIAAELLEYEKKPMEVNQYIFSNYTANKLKFLSQVLNQVEYFEEQSLAVLIIRQKDILKYQLTYDDSLDVIDLIMNVQSLKAAAVFLEMKESQSYKLSLRSKGQINVSTIAESLGGGGHFSASGAFIKGDFETFKTNIINAFKEQL